MPPLPPELPFIGFLGQNHAYSVTFRANGEAIVAGRIISSNFDEKEDLSNLSLRVPRVNPKDIIVFQIIRERECLKYKEKLPIKRQIYSQSPEKTVSPICEEYREPNYYQTWWLN